MEFCWVTLNVGDFERSLRFYHELLGLPICSRHGGNGTEIAMLGQEDKPKIELLFNPDNPAARGPGGITVGLAVSSLDETVDYLKSRGITHVVGPIAPNAHIRFSFISDPDGYEVQLVENR